MMEKMLSNIERYKQDLESLINKGELLHFAIQLACFPEEMKQFFKKQLGNKAGKFIKSLPSFEQDYQSWYSEGKVLVKQLLPDRLADFARCYEKPKTRKEVLHGNYCIEDYLQGLIVTRGHSKEKVVGPDSAIPQFRQQLAILKSVKKRFESSLFDIRQLVQADLFDSELDAARELAKHNFTRAAGALAGVVLERHLTQVCDNHNIKITKKAPSIADLNNVLKDAKIIDVPRWRFIQHLADIRNLCGHSKKADPTPEQVNGLLSGVNEVTKTLF